MVGSHDASINVDVMIIDSTLCEKITIKFHETEHPFVLLFRHFYLKCIITFK